MRSKHVAAAMTKSETDVCSTLDKKSALKHFPTNAIQEVHKSKRVSQRQCLGSVDAGYGGVKVRLSALRLTKTYPSVEELVSSRGKAAFTFHEPDRDDELVFGSKEGEYCLLKIRLENASKDQPVPVESILDVQMLYQTGGTLNLKTAETRSERLWKEVVILLEPKALQRRVTSGSPMDAERVCRRNTRFQLHIQVDLKDSKGEEDIVKTLSWRTVSQNRPSLWQVGQSGGLKAWERVSHVFETGLYLLSVGGGEEMDSCDQKSTKARRRFLHRSLLSKLSWKHVLNPKTQEDL